MKAYVFVRTLDFDKLYKCVWRGNIQFIPADGSSFVFRDGFGAERVESTMYNAPKGYVEIYLDVVDPCDHHPEIKRYWSKWPHWWPIQMHSNRRVWYKWLLPRRMTLKSNPRVHRWLLWVW